MSGTLQSFFDFVSSLFIGSLMGYFLIAAAAVILLLLPEVNEDWPEHHLHYYPIS